MSIDSLYKLMLVVGGLEETVKASGPSAHAFSSIDDVLSGKTKPKRKRGSRT